VCLFCKKNHSTVEQFPINETVFCLLTEKPSEVYRNDFVESLKLNMQSVEDEMIQLQLHMHEGSTVINEHCSKLVNLIENVQLDAHSFDEIKMTSCPMFDNLKDFGKILATRIREYEAECVQHFVSDTNEKRLKFNEINQEISRYLTEQKQYLAQFKINNCDITNADAKATQLKERLNAEKLKNKNDLFVVNKDIRELEVYLSIFSKINTTQSILA